jgi:hypothetical protein
MLKAVDGIFTSTCVLHCAFSSYSFTVKRLESFFWRGGDAGTFCEKQNTCVNIPRNGGKRAMPSLVLSARAAHIPK